MAKERKCLSAITKNIPEGLVALTVLIVSIYMVATGLNDPNKYAEINPAIEIACGGAFIFFDILYLTYLLTQIADDCKENKRIASFSFIMTIVLFALDVIVVIFISIEYYLFAIGFAFLLLLMFLYFIVL